MPDPLIRLPRPSFGLGSPPSPEGPRLDPLEPAPSATPVPSPPPTTVEGRSFREILVEVASEIDARERGVDAALSRARRGAGLSPPELIAVQAGVYRYAHELELATKLVDKASGALRQTLESQR